MRINRLILIVLLVTSMSFAVAQAQYDTNQIIGHLGHPVGTVLVIEGTKVEPYKGYGFDVVKINGQELAKPIRIRLANVAHPFSVSTNTVCKFKGMETTFIIKPIVNPKTGEPLQQAAPGRYFEFNITEVLAPEGVKIKQDKSPNKPSEATSQ